MHIMAKGKDDLSTRNTHRPPFSFESPGNTLVSRLQRTTYSNMKPLPQESNPYTHVSHTGALTNGPKLNKYDHHKIVMEPVTKGSKTVIYVSHETGSNDGHGTLPRKAQILKEFEEYLEAQGPFDPEEERKMRNMELEEKWKTVFDKQGRSPIFSPNHYSEGLRQHISGNKKFRPSFGKARGGKDPPGSLGNLLLNLKKDLKMCYEEFVEDFIKSPHNGIELLVGLLKDLQREQNSLTNSVKRNKQDQYKQMMIDEYNCLLCIKFSARVEVGLQELVKTSDALETIAMCLISDQCKTSLLVLQILTQACGASHGNQQVLDAMSYLRLKMGESVRFHMVVGMLNSKTSVAFQVACLHFFNTLWGCTDDINAKVFLQHELHMAGFDPNILDKITMASTPECEDLQRELDMWRRNYIDVSGSRQTVLELEARNTQLRQEIDRLQIRIQTAEKDVERMRTLQADWKDKSDKYRERAAELQDVITKLTNLYRERTGLDPEEEVNLEEAIKSLDVYGSGTLRSRDLHMSGSSYSIQEPPAPPAPPPLAMMTMSLRKKVAPRVNLPLFNWTPIFNVHGTLFEKIDDELMLREIDFKPFEEQFQLPTKEEGQKSREKRTRAMNKYASQIHFMDSNRAKNMIITKTRIAKGVQHRLYWEDPLSARDIKDAIDKCDLVILPGEYAELLLKYVPTKDEMKKLAQHAKDYASLGEAEQFLFHLAQVERLESKLSMMAFIGIFAEMLKTVTPQIDCVQRASHSVLHCKKFHKILEIILAYGNYMNSNKRGYTLGFKIESLSKLLDVKSFNRELTLMHHLVDLLERKYPDLLTFANDLDLAVVKGVSYQAIASDVLGLRKGVDLVKYEMEKQPKNLSIQKFHTYASAEVAKVAEMFHKMEDIYKKVCTTFGESYKAVEPDDFFGHISAFVRSFQKALDDNYQRRLPSDGLSPRSPVSASQLTSSTNSTIDRNLDSTHKPAVPHKTIDFTEEASTVVAQSQRNKKVLKVATTAAPAAEKQKSPGTVSPEYKESNGVLQQRSSFSKLYPAVSNGAENEEDIYARVQRGPSGQKVTVETSVIRKPPAKKLPRIPIDSTDSDVISSQSSSRPSSLHSPGSPNEDVLYETIQSRKAPNSLKIPNGGAPSYGYKGIKHHSSSDAMSPVTPGYKTQVDEAIDSLDQVLDDAFSDEPSESQNSKL